MNNYDNREIDTKCEFCESEDTTDHLLECHILQRLTQEKIKVIHLEAEDNIQEVRRIAWYIEQINDIKIK